MAALVCLVCYISYAIQLIYFIGAAELEIQKAAKTQVEEMKS